MVKVILFDFYGVFIPDAFESWLMKNGQKRVGIFADLIASSDKGMLSEDDFLRQLSDAIGRDVKSDEIHVHDPEPDKELVALARELKANYKVCLFSNASDRLRNRLARLGLDDIFEEIIVSSEIGHAKPSDEAFAIAVERVQARSDEIIFIDDNPKNIEAATRNGLHALLYTSATEVRETIEKLG